MNRSVLDIVPGVLSDYYDWLKEANSGDVLVYWIGDLLFDRQVQFKDPLRSEERGLLNVIADRIHADAKLGQVIPTQKRLGHFVFEYRITRCGRSSVPSKPSGVKNDDLIPA